MKKYAAFLLLILISGCGEKNHSRYQSINIPFYEQEDYYALLSHENSEIVYNSICNLIYDADDHGDILSNDTIDKTSSDYQLAENIYSKITSLLYHKDEKVSASAIRFLSVFGEEYTNKDEIINSLLKVKSRDENVQFELIQALNSICDSESKIQYDFLGNYVNNHSWLVSRATFGLIGNLQDSIGRDFLIVNPLNL